MNEKTEQTGTPYELLVIFAGSLKDSEIKKEIEKWEAEVTKIGKVLNKTVWENRSLAYKIKQEDSGTYFIAHFETEGEHIAELENALRLDQKVIRHLIYKTPHNYEWREYNDEELEHDFKKLNALEEDKAEKRFTKKKPAKKAAPKTKASATKKAASKEETKADVGEIDQKLDNILADL